jgi:hypothetical protein
MKRTSIFPGLLIALLAVEGNARAEETPHTWWVETRPWTCVRWLGPLAREIQLACDALGHSCVVASNLAEADRHAILGCAPDEEHWQLEARGADGARLWSVELTGEPEDRLRKAGVWAASAGGDAPIATIAEPSLSPERGPPILGPGPIDVPPETRPAPPAPAEGHGGIALTGSFMAGDGQTTAANATLVGARVAAAVRPFDARSGWAPASIGLALYGGHTVSTPNDVYLGTGGVTLGWGAPWTDDVFGVGVEGGGALVDRNNNIFALELEHQRATQVIPYVGGSVFVVARTGALRPLVAASVLHFSSQSWGPVTTGALNVGLVWSAF